MPTAFMPPSNVTSRLVFGVSTIRAGHIDEATSSPPIIHHISKSRAYLPRRFSSAAALVYSVKLVTPVSMHF